MSAAINDKGERVIPASRRPDGTWRKERKVKDGYVPQDEQPVYQSKAIMMRQGVPLCPGMDDAEVLAKKASAKKLKEKKAEPVKDVSDQLKTLSVKDRPAAKKEEGPSSASSPPPTVEDPQARMEKEARKLRKKIRECDALVEKQKKGESLTEQEQEKLRKLITWNEELKALENV